MKAVFLIALALTFLFATTEHAFAGVLYDRSIVPTGWTMAGQSPADASVTFMIALKQRNLDILDATFWAVSDPRSPQYQQFMTSEQVNDLVAPDASAVKLVLSWLLAHGVDESSIHSFGGDAIEVTTTVKHASALFSARFHTFTRDSHTGTITVVNKPWGAASVPDDVHAVIDFVEGLSTFPKAIHARARARARAPLPSQAPSQASPPPRSPADTLDVFIPQTIHGLYGLPTKPSASDASTSQGFVTFHNITVSNNDSSLFYSNVGINGSLISADHYIGISDPNELGLDQSMGVEWLGALTPAATPWFWTEGGETWLYGWSVHFLASSTVPQVVTLADESWEDDQCSETNECGVLGVSPTDYVVRTNVQFQKIGLIGVTIITGTGLDGASGSGDFECTVPKTHPTYPSSSPFVTAVSGTELLSRTFGLPNAPPICTSQGVSCVSNGTEVAYSQSASGVCTGGGFSNISSQPAYQSTFVATYLASGVALPPASYYNASGRAFPDVAALGQDALLAMTELGVGGGTTSVVPVMIMASVATLLNGVAIQQTGKPLGFLNPLLYQISASHPEAFHDITVGDNICAGQSSSCKGFYASKGWDPVTGLGSPNYPAMVASLKEVFEVQRLRRHYEHVVESA